MKKRLFIFLLSLTIVFCSVINSYQEVKAFDIPTAFWGTLEASRAFWTALQAGGGVRGGGVSLSSFERSSREDMQNLQRLTMKGYLHYCAFREKIRIMTEDSSLSEAEAEEQASTSANKMVSDFNNNAINVSTTTGSITKKDFGYWRDYCDNINDIAINGLGGSVGGNTSVHGKVTDLGNTYNFENLENTGENTFNYNGNYYIFSGQYRQYQNGNWIVKTYTTQNVPSDRIRIPYIYIPRYSNTVVDYNKNFIDVNRLTGNIIASGTFDVLHGLTIRTNEFNDIQNSLVGYTNFPVIVNLNNQPFDLVNFDYESLLSVSQGSSMQLYQEDILDALTQTEAGKAIKEGANSGERAIIGANSIPVKRSGIRVGEETATGVIGWDIPDARTLEGAIAYPDTQDDVIKGMGVISVPESIAVSGTAEDVVSFPKSEAISIPQAIDEDIPTTIDDVISVQGGEFYPTQIDITEFFPFCIPFDIAYCVNKFHVAVGSAPIIHIPIVYPRALQGVLGQSYDVIIDFNDYIVLRNVIRYFILLLFIIGLMQITRNLIRG